MKSYQLMQTQHIPMSIAEYHQLPHKFGWKYEYWDGEAHIQPREWAVFAAVPVERRLAQSPLPPRPVLPEDQPELETAFLESFYDSVEYCDWSEEDFASSGKRCAGGWFRGRRGIPMGVSRVAVTPPNAQEPAQIVGAALVVRDAVGPFLDLLYVRPSWQRQGLATSLVAEAMNALYAQGETALYSSYHPANEASTAWHKRFGFTEEADLYLTQHRLYHACNELQRREDMGDMEMREREILERIVKIYEDLWQHQARLADAEGMAIVSPILRHHAGRSY